MEKKIIIKGKEINNIKEVHELLASELDFGPYYGYNLDALWDMLTTDVEGSVIIQWNDSDISEKKFGKDFYNIIDLFKRVEKNDICLKLKYKFSFKKI